MSSWDWPTVPVLGLRYWVVPALGACWSPSRLWCFFFQGRKHWSADRGLWLWEHTRHLACYLRVQSPSESIMPLIEHLSGALDPFVALAITKHRAQPRRLWLFFMALMLTKLLRKDCSVSCFDCGVGRTASEFLGFLYNHMEFSTIFFPPLQPDG